MKHNKTFAKITLASAAFAVFCVALLIHFTSCNKPEKPYCQCSSIWDRSEVYHYPRATVKADCDQIQHDLYDNQEVSCSIK